MSYTLNIIKEGKIVNSFIVGKKQYATVPVKEGVQFQVLNEKGKLVSSPKMEAKGKDLWVFLDKNGKQPDIILQDYANFKVVQDPAELQKLNTTFATMGATPMAPQSSGDMNFNSGKRDAVLANSKNDAMGDLNSSKSLKNEIASGRKMANNKPATNDKAPIAEEMPTRSRPTKRMQPSKEAFDDQDDAVINGEGWSNFMAFATVATIAGTAVTISEIKKDDKHSDNTNNSNQPIAPLLSASQVTANNVIEKNEIAQDGLIISGKIDNVSDGTEVKISVGGKVYKGELKAGEFSVDVPTSVLVKNNEFDVWIDKSMLSKASYTVDKAVADYTIVDEHQYNLVIGDNADNKLVGTLKDDALFGGKGTDSLTGGKGADVFVFDEVLDGSVDVLEDFKVGEDVIALSTDVFTKLKDNLAGAKDYITYDNGTLSYNDGTGAVKFAILNGVSDFDINQNITLLG